MRIPLKDLRFKNNQIINMGQIKYFKSLDRLDLSNNNITNLDSLNNLRIYGSTFWQSNSKYRFIEKFNIFTVSLSR
jgi:hypothetical protein